MVADLRQPVAQRRLRESRRDVLGLSKQRRRLALNIQLASTGVMSGGAVDAEASDEPSAARVVMRAADPDRVAAAWPLCGGMRRAPRCGHRAVAVDKVASP